jgi:uncharacterized protein YcbX
MVHKVLSGAQASLADLHRRMTDKVPMNRFRPNIVVGGAPPWAEDTWGSLRISHVSGGGTPASIDIESVAPCSRCKVRGPVFDFRSEACMAFATFFLG